MDEHRLKCFIAVYEQGSVSAAAARLHMTQPPLSILLRKLEDELGVTLFDRSGHRLVPTATGELFYLRAKALQASVQAMRRELREAEQGARGTVHIGCATAASLFIASGTDVGTVAGLLGHSQPSTTLDIYTHAFDKNTKAASQIMQSSLEI